MTDWKALCQELLDHAECAQSNLGPDGEGLWDGDEDEGLFARARAALAQPEPEVVGPTDDSAEEWQWYTYCPEEGIELYSNRQQAQSAAQSIMGSYEVAAHSDGWHEDMELVSWGMLVAVEQAQVVECCPADPGGEFDEWVRYELRAAARHGRPAPTPAGDVGELVALIRQIALACEPDEWLLGNMTTPNRPPLPAEEGQCLTTSQWERNVIVRKGIIGEIDD